MSMHPKHDPNRRQPDKQVEIERLTARLIAESGEVEDLVNRLQESEDDNGRLMKRIAKLEANLKLCNESCGEWADENERLQARVDVLEAEVKLWRDNEQNCLDALNRIDELKSLLKGDDL